MPFRDDNVIVIEIGSLTTRAIIGLAESMTPPQYRVDTRVGRIKNTENDPPQYLFDEDLTQAIKRQEPGLEVISPIVGGQIVDWEAIEIFWYFQTLAILT
jgi:actin-related protein